MRTNVLGKDLRQPALSDPSRLRWQHCGHHRQSRAPSSDGHRPQRRHEGRDSRSRTTRARSSSRTWPASCPRPTTWSRSSTATWKPPRIISRVLPSSYRAVTAWAAKKVSTCSTSWPRELHAEVGASRAAVDAGFCASRPSDRPDGHHRTSEGIHCLWHQRTDSASGRHEGERHHHLHQQRSRRPYQRHCRLCYQRGTVEVIPK
jgi:hypothetical protein